MPWELNSDRPIFLQLIESMMDDIFIGKYKPGDQLPSVRDLALEASVNPNTMQKALSELERTGLVYSKRTSGRFVTEDEALIKELKQQRALGKIDAFLKDMEKIGLSKKDVIDILTMNGEN